MKESKKDSLFDIRGRVAVVTGGGGVLMSAMARELGRRGVRVVIGTRSEESACPVVESIRDEGGEAMSVQMDVTDRAGIKRAADEVLQAWGQVDILINGAGGNRKDATAFGDLSFFDLPEEALLGVLDVNLLGSIIPSQEFGRIMARRKEGVIVNISSMSAYRPLTRVIGYSAAKAAVNNFTQWLAVYMATQCDPLIRVNAIAPGFFETDQNRFLLREEATGALSQRGQQIIDHTPAGRFGAPEDLISTLIWLVSPSASFVTGTVIPVDGGFSAYAGV